MGASNEEFRNRSSLLCAYNERLRSDATAAHDVREMLGDQRKRVLGDDRHY